MLFIIIFLVSCLLSAILPWWLVGIAAFLTAFFIGKNKRYSFWSAFLAVALNWLVYALIKAVPNQFLLLGRVAKMFYLPGSIALLLVTALIGGLFAGMFALSGHLVRKAFFAN
jgi:hypothetical protein